MGTFERPTQECLAVAAVYFVFVGLAVTVWQSRFAGHGLLAMVYWPWVASVPRRTAGCLSWHIAVNSQARKLVYQILSVCIIVFVTRYTPSVTRSALTCTQ